MTIKLLRKELRLFASPLSYFFLLFGILTLAPGYPILLGAFFITFGIFQSFLAGRENHDTLYTALLPIARRDVVRAKFAFCVLIESCGFLLMLSLTLLRMTVWKDAAVYRQNALMNANPLFLGFTLVVFAVFNVVFVGGFFKTSYKYGAPFIAFIAAAFIITGIAEALHFFPGLHGLNATALHDAASLWWTTLLGAAVYAIGTYLSYKISVKRFERVDF